MRQWVDGLLTDVGVAAMYAAAFLEGAGLPLPYEAVFIAFGLLAELGQIPVVWGLAGLLAATTVGNIAGYTVGRLFGRRLMPLMLRRSLPLRNFWRSRRGGLRHNLLRTIIALRWVGFGFGPAIWIAGLQRAPFAWFVGVMLLVNGLWVVIWGLLAQTIIDFLADLPNPFIAVATILVVIVALLLARAQWQRRNGRRKESRLP